MKSDSQYLILSPYRGLQVAISPVFFEHVRGPIPAGFRKADAPDRPKTARIDAWPGKSHSSFHHHYSP